MRRWILVIILFLSCGFIKAAFASSLSPSIIEINSDRGKVLEQKITIINTKNSAQTYYLSAIKFTASENEDGSPKFIPPEEDFSDLPSWITFSNNPIIIPAQSFIEIPFSIAIPSDTPAGSYFAAVTVSETPSEIVANNGANIQAKTASLILLTVAGETRIAGGLLDFQVNQNNSNQLSGSYEFRLQNQGNVYFTPQAIVTFKDLFGRILIISDANESEGKILPNSTRTFNGNYGKENKSSFLEILKNQFSFFTAGPIKAVLVISLNNDSVPITSEVNFWYIPWQMLSLLIGAVAIVIVVYWKNRKPKKMCG